MLRNKDEIKACMKVVTKDQKAWADERQTSFGIMVGTDRCAVQYQRRVRLLVRLYYRQHPNLIPDRLCLVHIKDKKDCSCSSN